MNLLYAMRRLRHTLGQGLVAVFAVAWLGLVAHTCAQAGDWSAIAGAPADAVMDHGAHAGHAMDHGHTDTGHGDGCCCCDEPAAAPHCLTPACGASSVTLQTSVDAPFQIEPYKFVALPAAHAPPSQRVITTRITRVPDDPAYLPLHPTLRYCTLLI